MSRSKFDYIEQQFISENVFGRTTKELTKLFNNKFNKNISENTIRNYKKTNKLRSDINTKFKKNHVPHNKKNNGEEFISSDGYTFIKIKNKWIYKHRYIYEKYHGKIPDDYSVIFADQDKGNFNLENLILVRKKDKLVAKNKHLFFHDEELTKTGLLIAKAINTAATIKKIRSDTDSRTH